MRHVPLLALALLCAALIAPAGASARSLLETADAMAPGAFSWTTADGGTGAVRVVVSIPRQRAFVYRGDTLIGVSTVSTGKEGHATPVGVFTVLQKRERYFSNLYDSAPMPWMQRLTWDGIALHAGAIPGRPASHGCVRLPIAFARQLFALTRLGATVEITDVNPVAAPEPAPVELPADTTAPGDSSADAAAADPALRLASMSR